jgi:hypothetical protein
MPPPDAKAAGPLRRTVVVSKRAKLSAASASAASASASARRPSRLEQLPVEILQEILLLAGNVGLPMASPWLGLSLSAEHVRRRLVMKAFCRWHEVGKRWSFSTIYRCSLAEAHQIFSPPPFEDLAALQSALLRQRWLTHSFMKTCVAAFATRLLTDHLRIFLADSPPTVVAAAIEALRATFGPIFRLGWAFLRSLARACLAMNQPMPAIADGVQAGRFVWRRDDGAVFRASAGQKYAIIIHGVKPSNVSYTVLIRAPCCVLAPADGPSSRLGCQIPTKLLHGRWTQERGDYLRLLVDAGASIDRIHTTAAELLPDALADAICHGRLPAARALVNPTGRAQRYDFCQVHRSAAALRAAHAVSPDLDTLAALPAPPSGPLVWMPWTRELGAALGTAPTTAHVHAAVFAAPRACSDDMLRVLMPGRHGSEIDCEDRRLRSWIAQTLAEGADEARERARRLHALLDAEQSAQDQARRGLGRG